MDDKVQAGLIKSQCHTGDKETDHENADQIIIHMLRALGFSETADAWVEVGKWYA